MHSNWNFQTSLFTYFFVVTFALITNSMLLSDSAKWLTKKSIAFFFIFNKIGKKSVKSYSFLSGKHYNWRTACAFQSPSVSETLPVFFWFCCSQLFYFFVLIRKKLFSVEKVDEMIEAWKLAESGFCFILLFLLSSGSARHSRLGTI